jgi:hypothetical protein
VDTEFIVKHPGCLPTACDQIAKNGGNIRPVEELKTQLNDLYSLPNIVRVVKSRRMRWAGHLARMGEDRGVHRVLVGSLRERGH